MMGVCDSFEVVATFPLSSKVRITSCNLEKLNMYFGVCMQGIPLFIYIICKLVEITHNDGNIRLCVVWCGGVGGGGVDKV